MYVCMGIIFRTAVAVHQEFTANVSCQSVEGSLLSASLHMRRYAGVEKVEKRTTCCLTRFGRVEYEYMHM